MYECRIETICSVRYIPKIGKYIVKLGFDNEKAKDVWMSEKQISQLERCFGHTPHGYSTDRITVVGVWNDRGYYAFSRVERTTFEAPHQYDLRDLNDSED